MHQSSLGLGSCKLVREGSTLWMEMLFDGVELEKKVVEVEL